MTADRDVLAARAKRLAVPLAEEAAANGRAAIVVEIGAQQYAFPLAEVRRAVLVGSLTELPHVPPIVLGLGTIDGDVLAVFDGRVWMGGARRPLADHTPVLLLGATQQPLALAVDRFVGSLVLPPAIDTTAGWLEAVTDTGVLIVRVDAMLRDPAFSSGISQEGSIDDHH